MFDFEVLENGNLKLTVLTEDGKDDLQEFLEKGEALAMSELLRLILIMEIESLPDLIHSLFLLLMIGYLINLLWSVYLQNTIKFLA